MTLGIKPNWGIWLAALALLSFTACSDSDSSGSDAICGNGIVERGEQCDDGNTNSGDGCSAECRYEGRLPSACANLEDGDACGGNSVCLDGLCVEPGCMEDADCASDGVCLTESRCDLRTYECTGGDTLPNGEVCDLGGSNGVCLNGGCVTSDCEEDAECDNGNLCDGSEACVDNQCVAGSAPANGASCGGGDLCLNEVCITPSCVADADCSASNECALDGACDLSTYECTGGGNVADGTVCAVGGDDGVCLSGTCALVECLTDAECDNGLVCDGAERCVDYACVAGTPPADGASCGGGDVCADGACITAECLTNADCAPANTCFNAASCDTNTRRCVEGTRKFTRSCRLCDLTGPGTSSAPYGVVATDLGIAVRQPDGQMAYIFGDTFSEAYVGGGVWTSPVLLRSEPGLPDSCIEFTSAAGGTTAKQIIDYDRIADPSISTWLPSDAIVIGDRMYLHVIANSGLGNVQRTAIAYSDDNGENWTLSDTAVWPANVPGGAGEMMQLWTWERGDDGYVYVFSTKFISRDHNVILHRVPEDQILNPAAYEPWGWNGSAWGWGNPPSVVLPHGAAIGEMSLRRVEGVWILAYFNAGDADITIKVLEHGPTSNLHTAPTYKWIVAGHWGIGGERVMDNTRIAQLYGAYIHPDSRLDNMHLIISQWRTGPNWPYRSMQVVVSLP